MQTDSPQGLSSTDMPTLPEVIIDGHKVAGGSRDALSEIYEIINMANLAKMRKRLDDQAAEGWVRSYILNIVPAGEEIWLDTPGQSISIINDGPAVIQVGINDRIAINFLNVNQVFNLNFGNHKLRWFFVRCAAGLASVARVVIRG